MGRIFEPGRCLDHPLDLHTLIDVEILRHERYGTGFTLVTLRIEGFEHLSAENQMRVLTDLAREIETSLVDLIFYRGAGSVSVLLPGKPKTIGQQFAEGLARRLENVVSLKGKEFSFQVDTFPEDWISPPTQTATN